MNLTNPIQGLDSTYFNPPIGGFLNPLKLANSSNLAVDLSQYQLLPWFIVAASDQNTRDMLGTREKQPEITTVDSLLNMTGLPYINANQSNGILDSVESRFFLDFDPTDFSLLGAQKGK